MPSKMVIRIIPMLLMLVSASFAVAPGWVAKGVTLDYSTDSGTVTFTVTGRTPTEVKMEISSSGTHKAIENASLTYGQFWFDDTLLEDASRGDSIEGFKVTAQGPQTFAGSDWETLTLEGSISGAKTTRVYDKDSGLLLKQTVEASGAPTVTLKKFRVPNFDAVAIPPPQPPSQPAQPSTPTLPQQDANASAQADETDAPAASASTDDGETEEVDEGTCLAGAVLLMLCGFVFVKR